MIKQMLCCDTCNERIEVDFIGQTPKGWNRNTNGFDQCPGCIKTSVLYDEFMAITILKRKRREAAKKAAQTRKANRC